MSPFRLVRNTSWAPSGDQIGELLISPPRVRRVLLPLARSVIQTSTVPALGSTSEAASDFSFGERRKSVYSPSGPAEPSAFPPRSSQVRRPFWAIVPA